MTRKEAVKYMVWRLVVQQARDTIQEVVEGAKASKGESPNNVKDSGNGN